MIADRPLQEIVPLQLAEDRSAPSGGNGGGNGSGKAERQYKIVTQYSMGPIEEIGLLKMDFLGLRNLDVIEDAIDIIERSRGERIDMEAIPIDDARTYEMLAKGDSTGVFQFESEGMRDALRKVKPTEFADLVALGALYRPGAMAYIPAYAKGKQDPSSVRYPDPRLRAITEETHGCVIYQEQLMEIARAMAGFSGAQADDLRKAIGKKKRDLMATMKDKFMQGLEESGTSAGVAKDLWKLNEAAADYSFNKSHAACYGLISYRTAYLKANYPAEYMAAVISSVMNTKDKVPVLRQPLRGDGDRRPAAGRQLLRPQLRRLRERDPVRPRRGQERRPLGGRGDPPRPRGGADRLDLGLLRAGRRARRQQTRDRMPDQVRRPRLDRRHPPGDAGGAAGRPVGRPEGPGGRPARARARSSTSPSRRPATGSRPAPTSTGRRSPPSSSTAPRCSRSRRRRSAPTSPRTRSPKCARRCGPGSTARSPSSRTSRTAPG